MPRLAALAVLATGLGCTSPRPLAVAEVQYVLSTELPVRQELYRLVHGRYATDWRDLGFAAPSSAAGPSGFVRVLIHDATESGWSASTSDARGGGPVCVMYHGTVDAFPMAPHKVIPGRADAPVCAKKSGQRWHGAA